MTKTLPEGERLSHYTAKSYYLPTRWVENRSWHHKTLRSDQLAAIGYSLGYPTFRQICTRLSHLGIHHDHPRVLPPGPYCPLVQVLGKGRSRTPNLVLDVGCGRGELMLSYYLLGIPCIGADPSPGAATLVPQTMAWEGIEGYRFVNKGLRDALTDLHDEPVDTIIFCESIEHIREEEFDQAWPIATDVLTRSHGLLIIVNWIDFWPIPVDKTGYDHIRRIDNRLYDRLSKDARHTTFRDRSHLVLQF